MKKLCVVFLFMFIAACSYSGQEVNQAAEEQSPVYTFVCGNNSKVSVSYSEDGETAYIQLTVPELNLENKAVELKLAVSGSGSRYVNESNSDMVYEWHTKAKDGIISIAFEDGEKYSTMCVMQ